MLGLWVCVQSGKNERKRKKRKEKEKKERKTNPPRLDSNWFTLLLNTTGKLAVGAVLAVSRTMDERGVWGCTQILDLVRQRERKTIYIHTPHAVFIDYIYYIYTDQTRDMLLASLGSLGIAAI